MSHPWRLAKGLSGIKLHYSPIKGVIFADKTFLDPKKIANKFSHQFTPSSIHLAGDKSQRQLKRQFHQLPLIGMPSFTPGGTENAIRLAKSSTVIGPDGMRTIHLKRLTHDAINYLTSIFNLSIKAGHMPEIWHKAIIIPILKPGKDSVFSKNWRPISLLSQAAKTLEKILLPKIPTHIPFHPAQHVPWPKHSTCTALSTITVDFSVRKACFSGKKPALRTVFVALDLTAAFDSVVHH